jgi:16S rRNA processing protein RimM
VAQNLYLIGRIIKPQGIRGEVKVDPVTSKPERFSLLDEVTVDDEFPRAYTIESVRVFKHFALIKFYEINDRDGAEELRDKGIYVAENQLLSPGPDEYYIHDLIDCRVDTPKEQNVAIVVDVMQGNANDVLVLRDRHNSEILIPAVKDAIQKIDIKAKTIIIRSLEAYR